MDIDITFWIGVISLVLSFPLTIAANLATPRVLSYLEKRRLIKAGKTRKEALLWYNYLRAYHEGRRDKYPYYIVLAASAVLFAIASSTLFIFAFLITAYAKFV